MHTIMRFKGIQILNISFQYYSVFLSGLITTQQIMEVLLVQQQQQQKKK